MTRRGNMIGAGLAALGAALLVLSPAQSAPNSKAFKPRPMAASMRGGVGFFTPSAADPRLAAIFARGQLKNQGFRFTPVAVGNGRAVTVAVRSTRGNRTLTTVRPSQQLAAASVKTETGVAPVSYSLGAAVGWKKFALTSDVVRVDTGPLPGARERADLGVSYNDRRWSTRVAVGAERPLRQAIRPLEGVESYSVDVGGSYRLTRNLDVTAGVRYRTDRDRLKPIDDTRRDSQAVYVGTAFRF